MKHKPSIFLTGGSGLLALNWFFVLKNKYNFYLALNNRNIVLSEANLIKVDFDSKKNLLKQLKLINPSLVIHTAGLTSVEKCESDQDLAYLTNVKLSETLAFATKELKIPLVHISTDHIFDGTKSMYSEIEYANPLNTYGKTKKLAEEIVLKIYPQTLIIRTNFYGWGTSYRKSFSDTIIESLRNNKQISLFDDVYYTPIVTEKLINIVHKLVDCKAYGIYNVVSNDRISKYDFGILLAEEFNLDKSLIKRSSIKSVSNLVNRPTDMSLFNDKVTKLLNLNIGNVKDHIKLLHLQEMNKDIKEIQLL